MKLKKIISIALAVSIIAVLFSSIAFAEGEKASVYIADTTVYSVVRNETEIVVPIYVSGEIDMQCFDITVTYDRSSLNVVKEKTLIYNSEEEFSYYDANMSTAGEIHFTGITVDDAAKKKSGKIGELVFTYSKQIRKDDVTVELGLSIEELGFDTEVSDIEVVPTATITLNVSADPNPTESAAPTDPATPTDPAESEEPVPTDPAESEEPVSTDPAESEDPGPTGSSYKLGDVNGDGKITAEDALAILKHAAKLEILTGDAELAANVNEDAVIDASDALDVLKYAAQLIDHFGK